MHPIKYLYLQSKRPWGILKAGMNVLAIRVTDVQGEGGLWLPPVELGVEE